MSKQATLERLKSTIDRELTSMKEARDALMDRDSPQGVLSTVSVLSTVRSLINPRDEQTYEASQNEPLPTTHLLARVFVAMTQGPPSAQVAQFLEVHTPPIKVAAQEPKIRQVKWGSGPGGACDLAEGAFNAALQQVRRGRYKDNVRISAYHDESGTPLLFRKTADERTALTLVPFQMKGFAIPAGTIVGVSNKAFAKPIGRDEHKRFAFESWRWTDDYGIRPLRLSPWAYEDPEDRALFACEGWPFEGDWVEYDRYRADMVKRTSLEDYTAAAQRIVELCAN